MSSDSLPADMSLPGDQLLSDQELLSRFRQLEESERQRLLGIARTYADASGHSLEKELPHVMRQRASGELPA